MKFSSWSLKHPHNIEPKMGDIVIFRMAKAGEPLERFKEVIGTENGDITKRYLTHRGHNIWLG